MKFESGFRIKSLAQLYELLPENERILVDILRGIVRENLPDYCQEKLSYNVPFFYGHRNICLIWPATIPRGGIKEGVLFGFSHGNKLEDKDGYLDRGTNKQVFYKVYTSPDQIDVNSIKKLLIEAVDVDKGF